MYPCTHPLKSFVIPWLHLVVHADSPEGGEGEGEEAQQPEDEAASAEGSVRKPATEPELTRSLSSPST